MAIVPTGGPAWLKTSDHTTYGGDLNKANYQSQGPINPRTDVDAASFTRIAADMEALTRVAPFATVTYTADDTGASNPTVGEYNSMAGVAPVGVRNGDGDVTWTWLNSYADPYSVSGTLHIAHAQATLHGAAAGAAVVEILDVNVDTFNEVVRVRIFDDAGAAIQDATVTLEITTGQP